jgi:mannose-6-phosphate isomerase-like protein (cupin superfamily)
MTFSDPTLTQVRKPFMPVEPQVKVVKLSDSVKPVEPGKRNNVPLVTHEISAETEIVYQHFAPHHMGVYHVHEHAENIWIVTQGTLEAIIGGVRYIVQEGELIFMPSGVPHATGNPGEIDMFAVEIYCPPSEHYEPRDAYSSELPAEIKDAPR